MDGISEYINVVDLATYIVRYNQFNTRNELKTAVDMWCGDNIKAILLYGHISYWDVSGVTDMSYMFMGCSNFNKYIGGWDTHNVTNISLMFYNCPNFNMDIGGWDTLNAFDSL